jgi:4-hydroxybutyrate CoA-transferase
MDWAVVSVAPPEHGQVNFAYGVANSMTAVRSAKKVVVEIRRDYPWCEPGRSMTLPVDEVDFFVDVDLSEPKYRWPQVDEAGVCLSDADRAIAQNILSIMGDGDCLQVGIGAIPLAVVLAVKDAGLRHLGVHTEMGGEWIFSLMDAGCVDNSRKSLDPGRCAWNFMFPFNTDRYYEFLHHNSFFAAMTRTTPTTSSR